MKLLLPLLLLASTATAQIFPARVKDKATQDNLEYLYTRVQKLSSSGTGSYIPLNAAFGGDVSGTYDNISIPTLPASRLTGPLPAIDGSALTNLPSAPITSTATIMQDIQDLWVSTAGLALVQAEQGLTIADLTIDTTTIANNLKNEISSRTALSLSTGPLVNHTTWDNAASSASVAYSWGNHAGLYLTAPATNYIVKTSDYLVNPASFTLISTESDPIFKAAEAYNITLTSTSHWNTAYSWGAPYITSTAALVQKAGDTMTGDLTMNGNSIRMNGVSQIGSLLNGMVGQGYFTDLYVYNAMQGNITGNAAGNAATATSLYAKPNGCANNYFANDIAANGQLSCNLPPITSTAAIVLSTGVLKASIDAIILSTASLSSVILSTGQINADLQAYKTTVQVSTAAIVLSTGVIQASLNAVILSTAPLKDYANWNTAYGWGNHALGGYASQSLVSASTTSLTGRIGAAEAALSTAAYLASTQTFTGQNTFTNFVNISSAVNASYYQIAGSTVLAINSGKVYTFVGEDAGRSNTNGGNDTFIGGNSGQNNTTGNQNTFIGSLAGFSNTTGEWNTLLGYKAGEYNKTGSNNTILGGYAGVGATSQSFSSSTIIGYFSGGYLTTGSNNILLGWETGIGLTSGHDNIIIGYNVDAPANNSAYYLSIGDLIKGTIGGSSVTVAGDLYANNYYGNGATLTGVITSTASIVASTGTIQASLNAVILSTGVINAAVALKAPIDSPSFTTKANFPGSGIWNASGNVGIGTTAPAVTLDVEAANAGQILKSTTLTNPTSLHFINNSNFYVGLNDSTGQTLTNAVLPYSATFLQSGNYPMEFLTNSLERMIITGGGNVGIGTTAPGTALEVVGVTRLNYAAVKSCTLGLTTDASGGITGCVASDKQLKKDILPFSPLVDNFSLLNPVMFKWDEVESTTTIRVRDTRTHIGFIAQDIEKLYPEAVSSAGEGILGIDPNSMNAILVKKIQTLEHRISALEKTKTP